MPTTRSPRNPNGAFATVATNNQRIDHSLDNLVTTALDRLQQPSVGQPDAVEANEIKKTSRLWLLLGLFGHPAAQ